MSIIRSNLIRNIVLSLVVIGLLALSIGGYFQSVSAFVITPIISVQTWISTQYFAIRSRFTTTDDIVTVQQKNIVLQAEIARLQTQNIELQQKLEEYLILSSLLDFARAFPEYSYMGSSVIGRDPNPFTKYVILNRGSDDGVRRGMPVVTEKGLVGRISQVSAVGSLAQLVTDSASSIFVRIKPSGSEAILSGSITGDLMLDQIPQDASISPGDLILTSGLGGNFPPDLLIGQITGVRKQAFALFQSASVQPITDFSLLNIVLIISNFDPVDITPLIPTPGSP